MKGIEIIEKLKEGCFIEYSEVSYIRRIFLRDPNNASNFITQLNINSFDALIKKGVIKLESKNNEPYLHPNRTISVDIRKYIYSTYPKEI